MPLNSHPRGRAIVRYVTKRTRLGHGSPSYREIMLAVGLRAPSAVHYWVRRLCADGQLGTDAAGRLFVPGAATVLPGDLVVVVTDDGQMITAAFRALAGTQK